MSDEVIFGDVEGVFIGIDLGTSNSVVSFYKNNSFDVVKSKGKTVIPSVLYFETPTKVLFGNQAQKKGVKDPAHLLSEFKTNIGTSTKYTFSFASDSNGMDEEKNLFVLDTNIFIDEPLILKFFTESDKVVIPEKVIDELSYREEQSNTKESAKMAIDEICRVRDEESLNLIFEPAHLELLSEDLEKDSKNSMNDNKVLSIAKYYLEEYRNGNSSFKVKLITNDRGLQTKAKFPSIDVATFSLDDFNEFKSEVEKQNAPHTLTLTPKDASRMLLKHLKEESETYLNDIITKAVITVPANFSPSQINIVKEAGEDAGFSEIRIQKEPVAVGLAYALEEQENRTILVYDFGGGTFDASVLTVKDNAITVLAVDGDKKLGGKDITQNLVEFIYDELEDIHGLDMYDEADSNLTHENYLHNKNEIKRAAEEAKIELSSSEKVTIGLPLLHHPEKSMVSLEIEITRQDFEKVIAEIKKKSLDVVKRLISNEGIDRSSIDEIVMAGGTSRIPSIAQSITDTLGIKPKNTIDSSIVISRGAAICALKEWGKGDTIQETPVSIDASLLDFGVGIKDLRFDCLISSGEELPYRIAKEYITSRDDQENLEIEVYQRKSTCSSSTRTIDTGVEFIEKIIIEGIPPRPVGALTILVSFELTKDDTLAVDVSVKENGLPIVAKNLAIKKASNVK